MYKLERIKREARESAAFRGHDLTRFYRHDFYRRVAIATCKRPGCCAAVSVTGKPLPNESEISGDAVAVHCRSKEA